MYNMQDTVLYPQGRRKDLVLWELLCDNFSWMTHDLKDLPSILTIFQSEILELKVFWPPFYELSYLLFYFKKTIYIIFVWDWPPHALQSPCSQSKLGYLRPRNKSYIAKSFELYLWKWLFSEAPEFSFIIRSP